MWETIKSFVLKVQKSEIKEIYFENQKWTDSLVIANKFNEYFIDSINEIHNSIKSVPYQNLIINSEQSFKFKKIDINELKRTLKIMNNKKDANFVNVTMILDIIDLVGDNLIDIINDSLFSGVFPERWKETTVVPIEKVKNTKKSSEFRPINMISIEAKILEKVVYNQLEEHFNANNLMYEY